MTVWSICCQRLQTLVWLALLTCCTVALADEPTAAYPETIRFRYLLKLEKADPERVRSVEADMRRVAEDQSSKGEAMRAELGGLLQHVFRETWIEGTKKNLTFDRFATFVALSKTEPFGRDGAGLVALVSERLPAAWRNTEFLSWLRQRLPEQVDKERTVDRFLRVAPREPAELLNRLAFNLEVVRDADTKLVLAVLQHRVEGLTAKEMADWHRRLTELAGESSLQRWQTSDVTKDSVRRMGDRLFALSPGEWHAADTVLEPLVKASSHSPVEFFRRLSDFVRKEARQRAAASSNGAVLSRLAALVDASAAWEILTPNQDISWYVWLHETKLLPALHSRDRRLTEKSYELAKGFDAAGHLTALFPHLRGHYYEQSGFEQLVFDELLRPRAKTTHTQLVLEAALDGSFRSRHRELLGIDVLRAQTAGSPFSLAWRGGQRTRLAVAIALYGGLPKEPDTGTALDGWLDSKLLDCIVDDALGQLRGSEPSAAQTIEHLRPLAKTLSTWRKRGAKTAQSTPLRKLHDEVQADVDRALQALPAEPGNRRVVAEEVRPAVKRFVRVLALSFRLRGVMGEALGSTPEWTDRAIQGLQTRVFGIKTRMTVPDGQVPSTVYLPEATVRFCADMLREIDEPLRECLSADGSADDADRFWREIILPLAQFHGLLRVSREQHKDPQWPHWLWLVGATRTDRWVEFFQTLQTDHWLDADEAVLELAEEHRRSVLSDANPWQLEPDRLFAGKWGINAGFTVWKRLLDQHSPRVNSDEQKDQWRLGAIADRTLLLLEENKLVIGPKFPCSGSPPVTDLFADRSLHFEWLLNLVTATEWREGPFDTMSGKSDWRKTITVASGGTTTSSSQEDLFLFAPPIGATTRRVDGRRRAKLATLMAKDIPAEPSPRHLDQVELMAKTSMFLPNGLDNVQVGGGDADLQTYRSHRQAVWSRLEMLLDAPPINFTQRILILRHLMLIDVSRRATKELTPTFDDLVANAKRLSTSDSDAFEFELKSILAERVELLEILQNRAASDMLAVNRQMVDSFCDALGGQLPKFEAESEELLDLRPLRYRNWQRRIELLDDARVRQLLQVRRRFREVLAATRANDTPSELQANLDRIVRLLDVLDASLFFGRVDFSPREASRWFRQLPGKDKHDRPRTWRPALVLLCWIDSDIQKQILAICDQACRGSDPCQPNALALRAEHIRRSLFHLNESAYLTLHQIVQSEDAGKIFEDLPPIVLEFRGINFRVLTEMREKEIASADALSRDCFRGVLTNLKLVTNHQRCDGDLSAQDLQKQRDQQLHDRLFDSLSRLLPEDWQRQETLSRMSVDEVVRLADTWSQRASLPKELRDGAEQFLTEVSGDLLSDAGSVGGVLDCAQEIARRLAGREATAKYRKFYESRLLSGEDGGRWSPNFRKALAVPLYADPQGRPRPVLEQRQDIAKLLDFWRELRQLPASQPNRLAQAADRDFGRVLMELLRGEHRSSSDLAFVFGPAEALRTETGLRQQPPKEFFELIRWFLSLQRANDPEAIRRLFQVEPKENRERLEGRS